MKNLIKVNKQLMFCILISTFGISSCKKFVQVPPPVGRITENTVFTSDATAISVLTDLYNKMNSGPIQGGNSSGSISLFAGLASDEYIYTSGTSVPNYIGYYYNSLSQTSALQTGADHWAPLYNFVFKCNAAIEGLSASNSLTPAIKQQLLGEAKFLRAFFYCYLVNMYGDVPLVLSTDPAVNSLLARSPKASVYQQIIADLQDAEEKLSSNYLDVTILNNTSERVRPTKWAAAALLARVYLYNGNGDWAKAEEEASKAIGNTSLFGPIATVTLNSAFLKNSREAIWQIQPTALNFNTPDARTLIIPATGPSTGGVTTNPVILSNFLLNSFEPGDQRAVLGNWINRTIYTLPSTLKDTVYYPFKYKLNALDATITNSTGTNNMKEYFMVLRLGEQYLIRSEARAKQGNISGAQADLNAIRNRAGLPNTTATDQSSLLTAILNERRHELFSEWGHRWFDLKRTGNIDAVMSVVTPVKSNGTKTWNSYQQLYPLPLETIQGAPNVIQNPGY